MLSPKLRALWFTLVVLAALRHASTATAQSCHAPSLRPSDEVSWRTSIASLFATYSNASYTGEYQGVQANAFFVHPRVTAEVTVPYYRIVRNGLAQHGIGDVATDVRAVAFYAAEKALSMGPELAVSFPSGNAKHDLGMGHVMVMPGLWLKLELEKLLVIAQAAYGRAGPSWGAGAAQHHHHGGVVGPIVNPMNMSEVEHAFSLGYAVHEQLRLTGRLFGAVPVADKVMGGAEREAAALGTIVTAGLFDAALELQLPLAGSPFRAKTVLTIGAQW